MTTLQFISGLLDWLLADPSHIVAAASALAAATPTPAPNSVWGKLYQVLDIFALNILHAKDGGGVNVPPPKPAGAVVALLLAGIVSVSACANQSPATVLFDLRAGYDSALAGAVAYKQLPVCPATDNSPCHDPAVVAQIIKADTAAEAALDAAEDMVVNHPTTDAADLIAAAQDAVNAAERIITLYAPN